MDINIEDSYCSNLIDQLIDDKDNSNSHSKKEDDSFDRCYENHKKNQEEKSTKIRPESHIQNRRLMSAKNDEVICRIIKALEKKKISKNKFFDGKEGTFMSLEEFGKFLNSLGLGLKPVEIAEVFKLNNSYLEEGYISVNAFSLMVFPEKEKEVESNDKISDKNKLNNIDRKEIIEKEKDNFQGQGKKELSENKINLNNINQNKLNSNLNQNLINSQFKKLNKEISEIILQTENSIITKKNNQVKYKNKSQTNINTITNSNTNTNNNKPNPFLLRTYKEPTQFPELTQVQTSTKKEYQIQSNQITSNRHQADRPATSRQIKPFDNNHQSTSSSNQLNSKLSHPLPITNHNQSSNANLQSRKTKLQFNQEMVSSIREKMRHTDKEIHHIFEDIDIRNTTFENDCRSQLPKLNYCCDQLNIDKYYIEVGFSFRTNKKKI